MDLWQSLNQVRHVLNELTHKDYPGRTSFGTSVPEGVPVFVEGNVFHGAISVDDLRKRSTFPAAVIRHTGTTNDQDDPRIGVASIEIVCFSRHESVLAAAGLGHHRPDGMAGSRGRGAVEMAARVRRAFSDDLEPDNDEALGGFPHALTILSVVDGAGADAAFDGAVIASASVTLRVVTFSEPDYPRPTRGAVSAGTASWRGDGIANRFDFHRYEVRSGVSSNADVVTPTSGTLEGTTTGESLAVTGAAPYAIFARYRPYRTDADAVYSLPPLLVT